MLNVVSDYKELIPSMGNIVNLIYPVGSYYISETANNPIEDLLNEYGIENSWVKVERFLYGGLPEGKELGDEGGEVEHILTVEEMPSHQHNVWRRTSSGTVRSGHGAGNIASEYRNLSDATGGSQPHNNMPPYRCVNIWRRET